MGGWQPLRFENNKVVDIAEIDAALVEAMLHREDRNTDASPWNALTPSISTRGQPGAVTGGENRPL